MESFPRRRIPGIIEREMQSNMKHAGHRKRWADFGIGLDIPLEAIIDGPHALRGPDGLVVDLAEHDDAVLARTEGRFGGEGRTPLAAWQLDDNPARLVLPGRRGRGDLVLGEVGESFERKVSHPTRRVQIDAALAFECRRR